MPAVIPPVPNRDDQFFWDGARRGALLVQRCTSCARLRHPPAPMCPACGGEQWEPEEMSGRGTVHAWVASHHPNRAEEPPRIVALIELEEGVRMVSNLQDVTPESVHNDMAVTVWFSRFDPDVVLPQFRPLHASQS